MHTEGVAEVQGGLPAPPPSPLPVSSPQGVDQPKKARPLFVGCTGSIDLTTAHPFPPLLPDTGRGPVQEGVPLHTDPRGTALEPGCGGQPRVAWGHALHHPTHRLHGWWVWDRGGGGGSRGTRLIESMCMMMHIFSMRHVPRSSSIWTAGGFGGGGCSRKDV